MQLNKQTIIVGSLAVVGLYLFFKGEVKAAVTDITNTVNDVYTGVTQNNPVAQASNTGGKFLFDITHPFTTTAKADFKNWFGL